MRNNNRFICSIRNIIVLTILMNYGFILNINEINFFLSILGIIVISILYIYIYVLPIKKRKNNENLYISSYYELIFDCSISLIIESLIYIWVFIIKNIYLDTWVIVINTILSFLFIGLLYINSFIRVLVTSRQFGSLLTVLFIFLWWVPVVNKFIVKFRRIYIKSIEIKNNKKLVVENRACKTKYPIILVQGIFFRDWLSFNSWGRIPNELIKNGAELYYGKQQSSNNINESAEELKKNIMEIIDSTGCDKVNIIAHSKGGLDSRYAISCLGLDKYVASLTTINTPHRGCKYVDFLLKINPKFIRRLCAKIYNKTFRILGDKNPDFLGGVTDLTVVNCLEFNRKVLDKEDVIYQSYATKVNSWFRVGFPLSLGYFLCKYFEGDNDGLVSTTSAKWGNFLGLINTKKRGVSHGDIVDIHRKDVGGFNVCDFYINIVKNLKKQGL